MDDVQLSEEQKQRLAWVNQEMATRYPAVLPAKPVKETFSERFEEKTSAG